MYPKAYRWLDVSEVEEIRTDFDICLTVHYWYTRK